ncbi:MAG: cytochrome c [Bacteroidia bacterium]|nr:cytochrome c [Bacteroidia bacterium]
MHRREAMTPRLLFIGMLTLSFACACNSNTDSQPKDVQEGAALFISKNCVTCHGPEGEGGVAGPALKDLAEYYTVESLAEYLNDPDAAVQRDERLRERAEGYGALMPKYSYLPIEDRRKLAMYVLSLR